MTTEREVRTPPPAPNRSTTTGSSGSSRPSSRSICCAPGGGVVEAGRDPVAGEDVTHLLGPRGPGLADHPHGLVAAVAAAAPLPQEFRDRAVELLGRDLHGTRHPVVAEDLPGARLTADHDDGRPRPGRPSRRQVLRPGGGQAG
jgi:hypothetical protein